ncbi:MAG: hypothetical protein IK127_06490 [Clostridia bacterium]|nr:hypothetical protein [Clostridia bacterium]
MMLNMMNVMNETAMNKMLSEDVNAPALRNPMNHLRSERKSRICRSEKRMGWIDAIQVIRQSR